MNFTTDIHLAPYGNTAWNYASIPPSPFLHGVHRQNFITNTTMNRHEEKKIGRRGGWNKPNVTFRITKTPKLFTTTSV